LVITGEKAVLKQSRFSKNFAAKISNRSQKKNELWVDFWVEMICPKVGQNDVNCSLSFGQGPVL
jgi:hypothetical protein